MYMEPTDTTPISSSRFINLPEEQKESFTCIERIKAFAQEQVAMMMHECKEYRINNLITDLRGLMQRLVLWLEEVFPGLTPVHWRERWEGGGVPPPPPAPPLPEPNIPDTPAQLNLLDQFQEPIGNMLALQLDLPRSLANKSAELLLRVWGKDQERVHQILTSPFHIDGVNPYQAALYDQVQLAIEQLIPLRKRLSLPNILKFRRCLLSRMAYFLRATSTEGKEAKLKWKHPFLPSESELAHRQLTEQLERHLLHSLKDLIRPALVPEICKHLAKQIIESIERFSSPPVIDRMLFNLLVQLPLAGAAKKHSSTLPVKNVPITTGETADLKEILHIALRRYGGYKSKWFVGQAIDRLEAYWQPLCEEQLSSIFVQRGEEGDFRFELFAPLLQEWIRVARNPNWIYSDVAQLNQIPPHLERYKSSVEGKNYPAWRQVVHHFCQPKNQAHFFEEGAWLKNFGVEAFFDIGSFFQKLRRELHSHPEYIKHLMLYLLTDALDSLQSTPEQDRLLL